MTKTSKPKTDVQSVDTNGKPTVISLFAGCGGSSLGYQMAGYDELMAIDYDDNSIATFRLNLSVPIEKWDIIQTSGKDILNYCKIKKGDLDVLDGSPPCQGFSTAGKRKVNDPRNDLVLHYIRLINEIQPKVFVMENVSGMVKGIMKGMFKNYLRQMSEIGYRTKAKLLNAKYYNVPQSRQRIIFIGIREDIYPSFIDIEYFPKPNKKIMTVSDAFTDLINNEMPPHLSPFVRNYVPKMHIGQSLHDVGYKGGYQTKRINPNRPSPTLTKIIGGIGYGHNIHPFEDRVLSISELKRLHSLPDDFILIGRYQEKSARIGNSVPPLMMKAIAEHIKLHILKA